MLCVKNVSLRLPESRLLTNVNFTVDKGDIVTLMGPSGCGKSTLFSWMIGALAGQFSCTGELWLNEQRIDMLPTAQRQIGILFQDALLFDQFSVCLLYTSFCAGHLRYPRFRFIRSAHRFTPLTDTHSPERIVRL